MRVLFLDIDGVVNCLTTRTRFRGFIGIDRQMAEIIRAIIAAVPDLKIVLSSSWRTVPESKAHVEETIAKCFDTTPVFDAEDDVRGYEIQAWLELHPGVLRYAILDDDDDMLPHQVPHLFQTSPDVGMTHEIAKKVIVHLLSSPSAEKVNAQPKQVIG